MNVLLWLFVVCAAYGLWAGYVGAGLLAAGMAAFMVVAQRVFAAQERAYNSSPERAPVQPSTSDALDAADSECTADKL